jgi:hypothetical protein
VGEHADEHAAGLGGQVDKTSARNAPTSASPVLTPMRMRIGASRSCSNARTVSCIRRAARTARSASSSWATGAPNRATMPSPTILSTWPPKLMMSAASRSNISSTRFLTRSGSSRSDSAVKPTMSPNTTVTTRRSSLRSTSGAPHEGQNRAPPGVSAPQLGQVTDEVYGAASVRADGAGIDAGSPRHPWVGRPIILQADARPSSRVRKRVSPLGNRPAAGR